MSKKFMYLHGFGESSLLAGMAMKDLKDTITGAGCTLTDVPDGFNKLKSKEECSAIADKEYRSMVESGDLDAFSWYPLVKGNEGGHRKAGFEDFAFRSTPATHEAAAKKLVDLITKVGGVDGICGFSQGGELAYVLCEYLAKEGVEKPAWADRLKFVATFGSEDPFNQRGVAPKKIKEGVSFLICYGEKDTDAVHDSQTAKSALEAAGAIKVMTYQVNGLDHHMPKTDNPSGKAAYELFKLEMKNAWTAKAKPKEEVVDISDKPAAPAVPPGKKDVARLPDGRSVRALDDLMNDPNTKMFTWEIPPEAPPGWGRGNGEEWLIRNCGLYRPDHPAWQELHPEGKDEYWRLKNEEENKRRGITK